MSKKARSTTSKKTAPQPKPTPRHAPKSVTKRNRRSGLNDDIDNDRRRQLLELIMKTNSIRRASTELGVNNSTAKSIFYKFKQTGQINKQPRVNSRLIAKGEASLISESQDDAIKEQSSDISRVKENHTVSLSFNKPAGLSMASIKQMKKLDPKILRMMKP